MTEEPTTEGGTQDDDDNDDRGWASLEGTPS